MKIIFHFKNWLILCTFQNCRSLNHDGIADVKIHICIWDVFMPVYSVFQDFTAPHFKTTLLYWLTLQCQPARDIKLIKYKQEIKGEEEENSIRMRLFVSLQKKNLKQWRNLWQEEVENNMWCYVDWASLRRTRLWVSDVLRD